MDFYIRGKKKIGGPDGRVGALTAAIIAALALSGCMTIYRGGRMTQFSIATMPPGATAQTGIQTVTTPWILLLEEDKDSTILITKENHKSVQFRLLSKTSPAKVAKSFWFNTLAFGWWSLGIGTVIGMTVDAATGSLRSLANDSVLILLEPGEGQVILDSKDFVPSEEKKREKSRPLRF